MNSNCSWHLETLKSEPNHQFFSLWELEVWQMTYNNNRAPLLCHIKLCASFDSHLLIQTGVKIWKHLIWVKIIDFSTRLTLDFEGWPCKTIGYLFYATASFVHHAKAIWRYGLEMPKLGHYFFTCDLDLWSLTISFCMDITFVNGNNSWEFYDDTVTGTLCKTVTDRQIRRRDIQTGPFI